MSDERLSAVEIANAKLSVEVEHLAAAVAGLNQTVQGLRDDMNKGRGALWVMLGAASAGGAMLATFAKKMVGLV